MLLIKRKKKKYYLGINEFWNFSITKIIKRARALVYARPEGNIAAEGARTVGGAKLYGVGQGGDTAAEESSTTARRGH